ncbi:TolB family protein [Melioribacter sp. OK-6-Me]|uniref:TolB family protein n=1 Tax=Melioribacter sp. OK-6-Me TaxID=3423433 RepID=UPI003F5CBCDB
MKMKWYKYFLLFILVLSSCKEKSTEPIVTSFPSNYVIAYDTPGIGNIYLYNSLTKSLVNITSNVVDTFYYAYVSSFSDDGHELLFTLDYRKRGAEDLLLCDRDDIFSYNLITGQTIRITDTEFRETNPKYSKDKKTIVYQSFEKGYSEIYIIKQDSDNKIPVFIDTGWYPTFLSDDNQILYSSNPNYSPEFYLYNIKDRTKEKLININGSEPSVSTDNKIFVFKGSDGIYKYDFATRTATLLVPDPNTTGFDINLNPKISGDAKYILYINTLGPMSHAYLYSFENKNKIDMGIVFVGDFTKDSKNVVSLQRDGMHLYNIYSQKDSVLLPYQILSFDMAVSSIK